MSLERALVPQIIPDEFNPVNFLCKKLTNMYMLSMGMTEGYLQDFSNNGNSFKKQSFEYSTVPLTDPMGCSLYYPINDICNVSFNWGGAKLFERAYFDYAECVRLSKVTPGGNTSVPICGTWASQNGNNTDVMGYRGIGPTTIGCHNLYTVLIKDLLPLSHKDEAAKEKNATSYNVDPRDLLIVALGLGMMIAMLYSIMASRYRRGANVFFPSAKATTASVVELCENGDERKLAKLV